MTDTDLTPEEIAETRQLDAEAHPGPWAWFGNTENHEIHLATVHGGRVFVMRFRRWGMSSAQPEFQRQSEGFMRPATDFVRFQVDYRKDIAAIDHPDARFIARARDLLPRLLAEVERRRAAERVTCSHGVPLCLACAEDAERRALASSRTPAPALAERIATWVRTRFGESVLRDRRERTMRVVEEAIELAQAEGLSPDDVGRISARVFSRPAGEPSQEASGVGVTLIAWTVAAGVDLATLVEGEVARIEALPADHFRRKQAEKAAAGTALPPAPSKPGEPSAPPCGGSRCHQAADGAWIHSSKSYGTCSVRASKPGEE